MKKQMLVVLSLLNLAACTTLPLQEKVKPVEVVLTTPSLIQLGFVRLDNPNQFIDTNSIKKDQMHRHLVSFDMVENLTKGEYAYPEAPQQYAKSWRKTFVVNCESHELTLLHTAYYTDFWGEGMQSPSSVQHTVVTRMYKNSPYRILGQVVCTGIYQH